MSYPFNVKPVVWFASRVRWQRWEGETVWWDLIANTFLFFFLTLKCIKTPESHSTWAGKKKKRERPQSRHTFFCFIPPLGRVSEKRKEQKSTQKQNWKKKKCKKRDQAGRLGDGGWEGQEEHQSKGKVAMLAGWRAASDSGLQGFFSSRNIVAILLFHWESWLGFGMTINPGKRKTRRFALGKFTYCSRKKKEKKEKKIETKNTNRKKRKKIKRQTAH